MASTTKRRLSAAGKQRKRQAARSLARKVAGFPAARPEAQGLSPTPLLELQAATRHEVHKLGSLGGAAHVVLHRGRCVFALADGWANRKSKARFGLRTLCRLHGCTKPLVAAAFLTLVDEGRVQLSDPVSNYLQLGPLAGPGAKKAESQPTLRNLLTMTAGLKYDTCPAYAKVMRQVRLGKIHDLAGLCGALAGLPLQFKPGSRYEYSFCTDMLGRVCEIVSGDNLETFMQKRLLRPLGMKDTHFVVPAKKRERTALLYDCQAVPLSKRRQGATPFLAVPWDHPFSAPGIMSGGGGVLSYKDGGMYSTVQDYTRFCQMLLDGGRAADGRCVLLPATVQALWRDGLAPYGRKDGRLPGWHDSDGRIKGGYWDYTGWSLLNAHLTFSQMPRPPGKPAREGKTMWMGGGGGTFWLVDPARQLVSVSFTQSFGGRSGDDGLGPRGNDASSFATAAVDKGAGGAAKKAKR